jgi:MoxR-like ATPase
LPEAQLDRFFVKLVVHYPTTDEELRIMQRNALFGRRPAAGPERLSPALDAGARAELRALANGVHVDENVERYMVSVVAATRPAGPPGKREGLYRYIAWGASPRAAIALHRAAKIAALFAGASFVAPADVKRAAPAVLRHRIALSYEAEADGMDADAVIARILASVPVP